MPDFRGSYISYAILGLTVPVFPIILLAMGVSDRDSIIYPLRKNFRESVELAKAIEALGMIDELLSFYQYGETLTVDKTLPDIIAENSHQLMVSYAKILY